MKDVVRNEVLKLLDAGIIYPIVDSRWVSPVHCVPKKGGMTIVPNENNELIPQRVVDEGMTNSPPIFTYLVFGPGRVSLERLLRPIKAAV
jgi:hypothetical protein